MLENKEGFITSFISKIKGINALEQNAMAESIGVIKYKYILYKSKEEGRFERDFSKYFDFISTNESWMYHIKDDGLSRMLYDVLTRKTFDVQEIPKPFTDLKFVVVHKYKKVVFIECKREFNYDNKYKWINNSYKAISWFCKNFSVEGKNININYEVFLETMITNDNTFWDSLFYTLQMSEAEYELTFCALDNIICTLLYYCNDFNYINFEKLRENIQKDTIPFYGYLRQGIYMRVMDDYGFHKLPYHLYINIFKYAINPNCFAEPKDFFETVYENTNDGDNIIFDEETFNSCIDIIGESEEFIICKNKEQTLSNFMQLKEKTNSSSINRILKELNDENLITEVGFLYLMQSDKHFLCNYKEAQGKCSLSQYIEDIGNNPKKISELLLMVNDVFSSKASVRQKVFFEQGVSHLELVHLSKNNSNLIFGDISTLRFDKKDEYISFQYPLCMMQIVEKFMTVNSIDIQDIYNYGFIKLFPKAFTDDLIQYLITKEYKAKGMIGKLKEVLCSGCENKIMFLENIPIDQKLFQRITFLPQYKDNELVKNIEKCKTKPVSPLQGVEYISLDDSISYIANMEDLHLSKKLIERLCCIQHRDVLMFPEKLIVSKDIYDEKNYVVVGVVWNRCKLYKLSDLIQSKIINTENIYQTLICKIMVMSYSYYRVDKPKTGIGSLLLDDKFNILFDINSFNKKSDIYDDNRLTLNRYYTNVMRLIMEEFGDVLDNFTFFTFTELISENADLIEVLNSIGFCSEHGKLYLPGQMCPDCEKIYTIYDSSLAAMRYGNLVSKFYELNSGSDIIWIDNSVRHRFGVSEEIKNNVKLGIENDLYSKFVALVPKKLAIQKYEENEPALGVLYDDFDFSEIMEIESFAHTQRMKVILTLYNNILPYIMDYTFITSDKSVFSTMFMDKDYKGEIIIPNLPLLKTKVTLSSDESLKNKERDNTLRVFSTFLQEYITTDESLRLELKQKDEWIAKILEDIKGCNFNEENIKRYLATKNSYCKVHGKYFGEEEGVCPECMANGITKEKAIIFSKGHFESLKKKASEYEGGEANLYINHETGKIDKIFNNSVNTSFKSRVIGKALEKAEKFKKFNAEHEDIKFVPIEEVLYSYENGTLELEGYRQQFIPDSFKISSLKEKAFVDELGYERKDIIEILIKVCKAIEFLHSIGGFIGDLNGGNILIKDKTVYIIDMDGMSFDDVKNYVYTNMYIYPPSAENKNITALDDWYSLAIQAFYYLTYSHPFRGVCDNYNVPSNEMERMKYGYSLLGNHGIKIPNVSIGWDLIPKYVIDFFLETFEDKKRESMLKVLEMYLEFVNKNEMNFEKIQRQYDVMYSLSEHVYISKSGGLYYKEELKFKTPLNKDEIDIWLNDDCIAVTFQNFTYLIDDKTGEFIGLNKLYDSIEYMSNNKVYYTLDNDVNVYVDEFDKTKNELVTHILKRATENNVWTMSGNGANKFVLLEENDYDNTYDVYCNTTKVCSVSQNDFTGDEEASILTDEASNTWLVLISGEEQAKGIVIGKAGEHSEFTLDKKVSKSMSFYRNTLYFVDERKIYMYNVKTKSLRGIYCNVVNLGSSIERVDNKFIINNDENSYMYVRS